jgi:hypothetical protein
MLNENLNTAAVQFFFNLKPKKSCQNTSSSEFANSNLIQPHGAFAAVTLDSGHSRTKLDGAFLKSRDRFRESEDPCDLSHCNFAVVCGIMWVRCERSMRWVS